jgi:hypothetical protein
MYSSHSEQNGRDDGVAKDDLKCQTFGSLATAAVVVVGAVAGEKGEGEGGGATVAAAVVVVVVVGAAGGGGCWLQLLVRLEETEGGG